MVNRSICVYCGSSDGADPQFLEAGAVVGAAIARHGFDLVYGGGDRGIMGAVARAAKSQGGRVLGIIPRFLVGREADGGSDDLHDEFVVVETMHERKNLLFDRADAFVALPGGIGTLEELAEIMSWAQLGRHDKPLVLASIADFWSPMERLLSHMAEAGFIHHADRVSPIIVRNVDDVVTSVEVALGATAGRPAAEGGPLF